MNPEKEMDDNESKYYFGSRKKKDIDNLMRYYCLCSNVLTSLSVPWINFDGSGPSFSFYILGKSCMHGVTGWLGDGMEKITTISF